MEIYILKIFFLTKKNSSGVNQVTKFIEKPSLLNAKKVIKKKGYWNSGIIFATKASIINNFYKYEPNTLKHCINAVTKSKVLPSCCIKLNSFVNFSQKPTKSKSSGV